MNRKRIPETEIRSTSKDHITSFSRRALIASLAMAQLVMQMLVQVPDAHCELPSFHTDFWTNPSFFYQRSRQNVKHGLIAVYKICTHACEKTFVRHEITSAIGISMTKEKNIESTWKMKRYARQSRVLQSVHRLEVRTVLATLLA